MMWFALRGVQLLWSNPRLFVRRLSMLVRAPISTARALTDARRHYEQIESSYRSWLGSVVEKPTGKRDMDAGWPLLSVITPVHDAEGALLEAAIESVVNQTYDRWELCIADDASTRPQVRQILERYASRDSRIRVTYRQTCGHIAAASNTALSLATGEFVILLDHDDLLAPDALEQVAQVVSDNPAVDLVYSDEDKVDLQGQRTEPFFKPAWSPTLLTSFNYITHLAAMRRSCVLDVGGFREDTVGSQDHDLFLRVTERARQVAHIPHILYSWRMARGSTARASSAKPYAIQAARRALEQAIERRGLSSKVEETRLNGIFMVRHQVDLPARVSLIVDGQSTEWQWLLSWGGPEVNDIVFLESPQALSHSIRVVPDIDDLTGDYLIWIDASSRATSPESITSLLEHLRFDEVGVAGGTTRLANGTILQAGMAIGDQGQPTYAYAGLSAWPQRNFYLNLKDLPREVAAVWSGCCAMRRETWRVLGGWDWNLPPCLAMCDFCLRGLDRGFSNIYMPLARFTRDGNLLPVPTVTSVPWQWPDFEDPFWNPNLDPASPDGLPFRRDGKARARIRECRQATWQHTVS